jgi:hypothetical protein
MEQDFNETYTKILECDTFEEARPLYKKLYNALIEEIEKERGDGNFYEPFTKSLQFKEYKSWENAYEETIANDKLNDLMKLDYIQDLATTISDALTVEKMRTYAYEEHLKGKINDYVQLASDIQACYLKEINEVCLYDENESMKFADKTIYKNKLDGVDEEPTELDLTSNEEMRKHVESIVGDNDFQEQLDDMLDALESDDIEYVKGMLCAQHNDYFYTLAENYCYKNGLPIEIAKEIAWEFDKQEVKDEDKGLDDYEIKLNWVREEFDDSFEE